MSVKPPQSPPGALILEACVALKPKRLEHAQSRKPYDNPASGFFLRNLSVSHKNMDLS